MAEHTMTYQEKVKSYMKVFYILIGLTVVELILVELPKHVAGIPHTPMVVLICAASLAKAVYVAWYFMHLNHETPWLRKLVLLSMTTFFYAAVLIPDTIMSRKQVKYIPEPPRVHLNAHETSHSGLPQKGDAGGGHVEAPGASSTPDGIAPATPTGETPSAAPGDTKVEAPSAEEAEWK